jgi:hypothetical protein
MEFLAVYCSKRGDTTAKKDGPPFPVGLNCPRLGSVRLWTDTISAEGYTAQ